MLKVSSWSFLQNTQNFYVDFENATEFEKNVEGFEDNCVWTCSWSSCQIWKEDMWSAVNVLKSSPKIWDSTKRHHTQLNLLDINEKLA